jgi:hypothetical protein
MSEKISAADYRAMLGTSAKKSKEPAKKQISTTKAEAVAGILEKAYDCIHILPQAEAVIYDKHSIEFHMNGYKFKIEVKQI